MMAEADHGLRHTLASFGECPQGEAAENSMLDISDYFSPITFEEN
jgi:hypothetical protein